MKRFFTLALAAVLALSVFAGCANSNKDDGTAGGDTVQDSALQVLQNIWSKYAETDKFAAFGGDSANMVDSAPGAFDITNTEELNSMLLVSADRVGQISEAASLIHMMNANVFTAGAFTVTGNVDEFVSAQKIAIENNQWICGQPGRYLLVQVGSGTVVMAFGDSGAMDVLRTNLTSAYPEAQILSDEVIA